MSVQAMEQVIERVMREPTFRERIYESPARALLGYDLTPEERTVLLSGDWADRRARGVDPRISHIRIF